MRTLSPGIACAALAMGTLASAPLAFSQTTTPIQHVVVIFGENVSFDHYFGTYPNAVNPPGQPRFRALAGTPAVNGLKGSLLTNNPNLNSANGSGASNPFRLNRDQALTASQTITTGRSSRRSIWVRWICSHPRPVKQVTRRSPIPLS